MGNNKILLLIKTFILGILLGFSIFVIGICIYKNYFFNDSKETLENLNSNIVEQNRYNYEVSMYENNINISDIVKWNESDLQNEEVKYANIKLSIYKSKEISSIIKINNIPSNANCSNNNLGKQVLINDRIVLLHEYEGCYLINYYNIFLLNNYIGIYYGSLENPLKVISLFDINGNLIFENNKVIDFNISNYTYKSYNELDKKAILNLYKLEINNNKIIQKLISKGNNSYCDMLCEGEYCC